MKKGKKIIALITAVSLSFGAASAVFAADDLKVVYSGTSNVAASKDGEAADTDSTIAGKSNIANSKEGEAAETDVTITGKSNIANSKEGEAADTLTVVDKGGKTIADNATPTEVVAADTTYADLEVTSKYIYNNKAAEVGTYPEIKGYDALNERIARDLLKIVQGEYRADNYPDYQATENKESLVEYGKEADIEVSYKDPVNNGRYAKISIDILYRESYARLDDQKVVLEYYVDKDTKTEITKDTYDSAIKAIEEAAKEAEKVVEEKKEEVVLVALRAPAEELGYTVTWDDATKSVIVTKGDVKVSLTEGKTDVIVNGKTVTLETAPTRIDSVLHVPSTFFSKALGAPIQIDATGKVTVVK